MPWTRKYKTGKDFDEAVDAFITYSKSEGIRPTDYRVCDYLGISQDTLERYAKYTAPAKGDIGDSKSTKTDESNRADKSTDNLYAEAIKKLVMYRQDWYLSHAEANPKLTAIDIFALKQPCNGGWADKQQTDNNGSMSIDIKLSGASGEAFEDQSKTDK